MSEHSKLLFISGSARSGSYNRKLARLGERIAEANGIPSAFADLGDYKMPIYDGDLEQSEGIPEAAYKLKHLMSVHDGIFIASPEYNAGISPLLKNALDWVSRISEDGEAAGAVFKTRVFALGAATPSGLGGIRGLLQLREVLSVGLGAMVIPDQAMVSKANDNFDDDGKLKNELFADALKTTVLRLARAAHMLHGVERK